MSRIFKSQATAEGQSVVLRVNGHLKHRRAAGRLIQHHMQGNPVDKWNMLVCEIRTVGWGNSPDFHLGIQTGTGGGDYQEPVYIDDVWDGSPSRDMLKILVG